MSETNPSQAQHEQWQKMIEQQAAQLKSFQEQAAALEAKNLEQARAAVDQMAKLVKDSFGYAADLSAEWRKLSLEATRRAADLFTPKA